MDTPARNAPSATENPAACASAAVPRQIAIATSKSSSELHVILTRRNRGGITLIAAKTSGISKSRALPSSQAAAIQLPFLELANTGMTTYKQTTAGSST